jgi:hypothetical protein
MRGKQRIMNRSWALRSIGLLAIALLGACSSLRFEPTANWLSAGGQLCAASHEAPFSEFDRAAPRSCAVAGAPLSNTFLR